MLAHGIAVTWVISDQDLVTCCETLAESPSIAIDTEFMRSNTFYPIAALFQLADKKGCYLIDPLGIKEFSPLAALFLNPQVEKVIHACSEDLEVFNCVLNCVPTPLVDSQIAASMLGMGSSLGYANLVQKVLGVELAKEETRSNWLQRPLDEKQQHYAVQDVEYLLAVWDSLKKELIDKQRIDWLMEDCNTLVAAANAPTDFDSYFLRIKSAWKLSSKELALLKLLSHWREKTSRELDIPRNHLIHEKELWEIAKRRPQTIDALKRIEGIQPRRLQRHGKDILAIVTEAEALTVDRLPERLPGPFPVSERDRIAALKEIVEQQAEQLALPPEVLVKKTDYEALIRSGNSSCGYQLPARLQGWRSAVIGEALLDALNTKG